MRFRLIEDHRDVWPVRVMCNALNVSPSGFYAWRSRPQSARKLANHQLLADIRRVHARHRERYGAPRIHAELRAEGHAVSRKRVARLMHRHGIRARAPRRYRVCTTDSSIPYPWRKTCWARTSLPTGEGGLYLAVIPRPVHPQSGRLGDARSHAGRAQHRRAHHGNPTAASGSGPHSSFRSRQPICRR